jgi:RpiR family carbohydrate utilization transcriptional regulator
MILEKIKATFFSLTDSEKKVANYILNMPQDVIHYSITELANWSGSSETTVYRLVKKLGYTGYQKFKIDLARQISLPSLNSDKKNDFMHAIYNANLNIIKNAYDIMVQEKEKYEKVADRIIESVKILFYAVGLSYPVGVDASLRFSSLGIPSPVYCDPHMQVMVGANLNEKSVLICISHSGVIRDIKKSAEVAKASSAFVVAVTSSRRSPLGNVADITLHSAASDPNVSEFMINRIGEMFVVDVLYNLVVSKIKNVDKHFEKLSKIMKPKRYT